MTDLNLRRPIDFGVGKSKPKSLLNDKGLYELN